MGFRKPLTIHTLTFDEYEGLEVRMKGIKIGKLRKLLGAMDRDDDSMVEIVDQLLGVISDNLISWTLEDEEGVPIPADADGVDELEFDMMQRIIDQWLTVLTGPSEELGKGSASGATSPVPLPTMEAL